jgi:acetyl esterase/lipase
MKYLRLTFTALVIASWVAFAAEPPKARDKSNFRPPPGQELISDFVFGTGGGRELHAEILRPKEPPKEPMPAVLIIHGGGWAGGTHLVYAPWLVEKGYFTASIEYRLSGEAAWPAQIEDCKLAVRWLRANAAKFHVNPDRIGVTGHSAGGHLVACLGTLGDMKELEGSGGYAGVSSRVQAVVDQCGPTDFTPAGSFIVGAKHPGLEKLFGGTYEEKKDAYRQASPALHANATTPPFLIVHGENDKLVPIAQSERLADALKKAGATVELLRIKNGGHGLRAEKPADPPAEPDLKAQQAAMLAFFDKHLKK